MYKLTFYDNCCSPIADGTISYFVDDLTDFESHWYKYAVNESTVKRYQRSKSGEIVTDYYSDSQDLNIVQEDPDAKILEEKKFEFSDIELTLSNFYDFKSKYHFSKFIYVLRKIIYDNVTYIIARYKIEGPYTLDEVRNRITGEMVKYRQMCYYGNSICEIKQKKLKGMFEGVSEEEAIFSNRPENYQDDIVESFVWHIIQKNANGKNLKELTRKELEYLLRDIPGEAG